MAKFLAHFPHKLNESLQIGDTVYWVSTTSFGPIEQNNSSPQELGIVEDLGVGVYPNLISSSYYYMGSTTNVQYSSIGAKSWIEIDTGSINIPSVSQLNNSMLFFSKDNSANLSDIIGYYALASFSNDSTDHAELFQVGSELYISSGHPVP